LSSLIFLGVGCHGGFHSLNVLVHVQFMRVFCSARKGRAWGGGGGARAGGKESSVLIDFFFGIFEVNVSNLAEFLNDRTLCLSSGREQEERGDSNAKCAQKRFSCCGWGGVEDGCEFVGDVY
jgi:hypothetical protein